MSSVPQSPSEPPRLRVFAVQLPRTSAIVDPWIHSGICAARIKCKECRTDRHFRETLHQQRAVEEIDFQCPYGFTSTTYPPLPDSLPLLPITNPPSSNSSLNPQSEIRIPQSYDLPKIWGPRLWKELHEHAMEWEQNYNGVADPWLCHYADRIPCKECRKHWDNALKVHPPDWTNYFQWTVIIHNEISRLLGKTEFQHP